MLVMLVFLPACVQTSEPLPVATPPAVPVADQEKLKAQWITRLLVSAQNALNADHLMTPKSDNAYGYYQQVLRMDGKNAEAHWGMHQITSRYMELAEQAFKVGSRDKAMLLLDRALSVAAMPADAERLKAKYPSRPSANNEFSLSVNDLSARNEKAKAYLAELAEKAKLKQSRIVIVARTDAEGRWIYQQMRTAVNGYRLRGNIEIGVAPKIVLIDWADA